jgi:hypothetical protein
MTVLFAAVAVSLLAVLISGQCNAPAPLLFRPGSSCPAHDTCDRLLCTCLQVSGSTIPMQCMRETSLSTCADFSWCFALYFQCAMAASDAAASTAECRSMNDAIHSAILATVVGSYDGSILQDNCRYRVCNFKNVSSAAASCDFGSLDQMVCYPPPMPPAITQAPTTVPLQVLLRSTIRFTGSAYTALLIYSDRYARLEAAVKADIAAFLGVPTSYLVILGLTKGSLIVEFVVLNGAPKTSGAMADQLLAATGQAWNSNLQAVYREVSSEVISIASVEIPFTAAERPPPLPVANPPPTSRRKLPTAPPLPTSSAEPLVSSPLLLATALCIFVLLN